MDNSTQNNDEFELAREAVRQYGLRKRVAEVHREMMNELKTPVRTITPSKKVLRYSMSVAAGIILLVGAFMIYNFFTLSPDKVYASRYQAFEISTTRSNSTDDALVKAYREKNYREVVRIHSSGADSSIAATFFAAMSNLELSNLNEAILQLEEVVGKNRDRRTPVFRDEAEYYLALSYIKNRDYDLAIPILEKIKDDPIHIYHEKVDAKLIRKIKMLKWR